MRMHHRHAFATKLGRQARWQAEVEAAALLGHGQRLDARLAKLVGQDAFGRRRQRYRQGAMAARLLLRGQAQRHPFLAAQPEGRQDMRDDQRSISTVHHQVTLCLPVKNRHSPATAAALSTTKVRATVPIRPARDPASAPA